MGKHRFRLLVCGVGCLALVLASTLILDWFHATVGVDLDLQTLRIDLHSLHVCRADGICSTVGFGNIQGFYTSCAEGSLWGSLLFAGFVVFQVGTRINSGFASPRITKIGYAVGTTFLSNVLAAGYLFIPESTKLADGMIEAQRTWAPLMLMVAYLFGFIALALSVSAEVSDDDFGEYKPITIPGKTPSSQGRNKLKPVTSTLARLPKEPASAPATPSPAIDTTPTKRAIPDEIPFNAAEDLAEPTKEVVMPSTDMMTPTKELATTASTSAPPQAVGDDDLPPVRRPVVRASTAVGKVAAAITREQLRKKLLYATAIANVTGAGIEAKREDGLAKLVRWREVVGVVARRLPAQPPFDGITFVDLVSTAGSTLRILPWTRLTGEALEEDDEGEVRARAFVQLVVVHCPDVHLDPATRTFLGGRGHAAQLPDGETLAAHDARLA